MRPELASQEVELKLDREHLIRGRVVNVKGQPTVAAQIRVLQSKYPYAWWQPPPALAIWAPTTTDDRGFFLIKGLGAGKVCLQIEGKTITPQRSEVESMPAESDGKVTLSVSEAKRIRGRVVFANTGKAAAGATIISLPSPFLKARWLLARTDANGNFAINPFAPDERLSFGRSGYYLDVFPPPNTRYTVAEEIEVPATGVPGQDVEVRLQRGVLVKGRVTEAASGEPIAGARVQYKEYGFGKHVADAIEPSHLNTAISGPDGRFELPVPTEPGLFLVLGPTPDYIRVESSVGELGGGKPGGERLYADAVVPLKPGAGGERAQSGYHAAHGASLYAAASGDPTLSLLRRVSWSHSRIRSAAMGWATNPTASPVPTVGLSCAGATRTKLPRHIFTTRPAAWGQRLSSPRRTQPSRRLCGPAALWLGPRQLVDADGKPRAKLRPLWLYVLAEGAPHTAMLRADCPLEAVLGNPISLDRSIMEHLKTDDDGRMTFRFLVPGATYMVYWPPRDFNDPQPWPHLNFSVNPGEVKELGKVVMENVFGGG